MVCFLFADILSCLLFYVQKRINERGYVYKGTYEGWYCMSDEAFLSDDQVIDVTNTTGETLMVSLYSFTILNDWFFTLVSSNKVKKKYKKLRFGFHYTEN